MEAAFSEPLDADYGGLARRWTSAAKLIEEEYEYQLCQDVGDIEFIQRTIDDELIDFNDAYAVESLGVAFGRVLARNIDGLDWWVVDDEYGRDVVIRYGETSFQIDAMHVIGKRLQQGVKPDVQDMYTSIERKLDEVKDDVR